MFDPSVNPSQGFSQYSPFTDAPKPPGPTNPPAQDPNQPQQGGGTPSVPVDPTLMGWRSNAKRPLGGAYVNPQMAPNPNLLASLQPSMATGQIGPLQGAIAGHVGITDPGQGMNKFPQSSANTSAMGQPDLSNPTNWMNLVGNDQSRLNFVKQTDPTLSDADANYYSQQIKGSPGANPNEQAGGATYWAGRIKSRAVDGGNQQPSRPLMQLPTLDASQTGSDNPLIAAIRSSLTQPRTPQVV